MDLHHGSVVSDLHLLARHANGHRYQEAIRSAARRSGWFVLNGDIFDFHWSRFATLAASLAYAESWLRELVQASPNCRFVVLTGNHDCLPSYEGVLERLALEQPNLTWTPDVYALGDHVFLHGDAMHARRRPARLLTYRERGNRRRWRVGMLQRLYSAATHSRAHRLLPRALPRRYVVRALHRYLDVVLGAALHDIRHVYFGHTHVAFSDYVYRGLRFHNTGAAVRGERLRILEFAARSAAASELHAGA